MQFTILSLAGIVALVAAAPAPSPAESKPTLFAAKLYSTGGCSGSEVYTYTDGKGACVNVAVPGSGSAQVLINQDQNNQARFILRGYTGTDCSGSVVIEQNQIGVCTPLNGAAVQSWSYE